MKVLLINSHDSRRPSCRDFAAGLGELRSEATLVPPMDLAIYATRLSETGSQVRLVDQQVDCVAWTEVEAVLQEFGADRVISTVSQVSLDYDIELARRFHARGLPVYLKTAITEDHLVRSILEQTEVEAVILGECDLTIEQVVAGKDRRGTAWLEGTDLKREAEEVLYELDRLPMVDRSRLRDRAYAYPSLGQPIAVFQTSRGCPYPCGYYCPYPMSQGKKWRAMSAPRMAAEMAEIARLGADYKVLFRDPVFTLQRKRTAEFCRLLQEQGTRLSWWCETRVDRLDRALIADMAAAGCRGLNVGVESGNQYLIDGVAKTGLVLDHLREIRAACRDAGVKIRFLLLLGLPGETRASLWDTFELVHDVEPDYTGIQLARAYPGTEFYQDARRQGILEERTVDNLDGHGLNVQVEGLTEDVLVQTRDWLRQLSYMIREGIPRSELRSQVREYLGVSLTGTP